MAPVFARGQKLDCLKQSSPALNRQLQFWIVLKMKADYLGCGTINGVTFHGFADRA